MGVLGVVEMITVQCFRRLPHTKYRLRGQETWTICLAVVAAYWGPARAQGVVTDIRQDPNLPMLPRLYITPHQVSTSCVRIIAGTECVAHTIPRPRVLKYIVGLFYSAAKRRCVLCEFSFILHKPYNKNDPLFLVCSETVI